MEVGRALEKLERDAREGVGRSEDNTFGEKRLQSRQEHPVAALHFPSVGVLLVSLSNPMVMLSAQVAEQTS